MPSNSPAKSGVPLGLASDELFEMVYHELRLLAHAHMSKEYVYSTLQGTSLVHEVWLKLGGDDQPAWKDKRHLFAAASEAMRRILVDRARKRSAVKHGGKLNRVNESELLKISDDIALDNQMIRISDALEKLNSTDPRKAELVRLRYIFGLSFEEVAETMGISLSTAKRWWAYARSWLYREIASG